jgi:hypothetical protein
MSSPPVSPAKNRPSFGWFVWLCGIIAAATIWLYPRLKSKEKPLSRAEKKQQRKAMAANQKKKPHAKSGAAAT